MPLFQVHGPLCGRPGTDFIGQPPEMGQTVPGFVAQHGGHQVRPSPSRHIDDRISVAENIAVVGQPAVENIEVALRLVPVAFDGVGHFFRRVALEMHRLAGIGTDTGRDEHQPGQ